MSRPGSKKMPRSGTRRSALRRAALALGATLVFVGALGVFEGDGAAAAAVAPRSTSPPTISGSAVRGQTLTASTGGWAGTTPITFSYHWQRCNASGGSCVGLTPTGSTITLGSLSVGYTFRVKVIATNADGARSSRSAPTAVVAAPATTTSTTPTTTTPTTTPTTTSTTNGCATSGGTVPVADVSRPAELAIDGTQISPSTVTYGTRLLTVRIHVSACGGSVDGALVYVTAVPYGQFGIPNEQATGPDGWATLQFTALAGFPVSSKQQLLVMFVRATAPGASVIGGISARLLVSFHVIHG
jgi:hypothetical protein